MLQKSIRTLLPHPVLGSLSCGAFHGLAALAQRVPHRAAGLGLVALQGSHVRVRGDGEGKKVGSGMEWGPQNEERTEEVARED